MSKKLLTTVAFASLMTSTGAFAADAPPAIKINAFMDSFIQTVQETYPINYSVTSNRAPSTAMVGRFRLRLTPEATTNGINYGAQLRLNAANDVVAYDRAYGFIGTADLGKLTFGRASYLGYAGSISTVYGNNGSLGGFGPNQNAIQKSLVAGAGTGSGLVGGVKQADVIAASYVEGVVGNGWNRINYETPSIMGAQLGVSYTPKAGDSTVTDWTNNRGVVSAGTRNIVEVAAKYNINLSGLDMTVAGGYVVGSATNPAGSAGFDRAKRAIRSFGASWTVKYAGVVANINAANAGTSNAITNDGYRAPIAATNKANAVANDKLTAAGTSLTNEDGSSKNPIKEVPAQGPTVPRTIGFVVNLGYESGKAAGDYSFGGYFGKGQSAGRLVGAQDSTRYTSAKVTEYGIGAQYVVIPGMVVFVAGDRLVAYSDNKPSTAANSDVDTSAGSWTDKVSTLTVGTTLNF